MGRLVDIGASNQVSPGDDATVRLEVLTRVGVPVNVSGWTSRLVVSNLVTSDALLTVSGSVSGSYNAVRASNTQRISYLLPAASTALLTAGDYAYSIRRMDDSNKKILAAGTLYLTIANQP